MPRACPSCGGDTRSEMREISPGAFAPVEVCPRCARDGPRSSFEVVTRKAFRIGGSLAIRIPRDAARTLRLEEGTEVRFRREGSRLYIERAS